MMRTAELIIAAFIALILLTIVVGLILIIAHVYRLTQRVRRMEESLQEDDEDL